MIQRIQSVFLIAFSLCMIVVAIAPLSKITDSNEIFTLYSTNITNVKGESQTTILFITQGILTYFTAIIGFITILLYKRRKLQMLLCMINMCFIFLLCNLIVLLALNSLPSSSAHITFKITAVLPVISFILLILSYRAIKKDEELVRSLNRIR